MIDQLYQKAILKHAATAVGNGIIENADRKEIVHNPLCGDRITVYLSLDQDKIKEFSHETKACALCQASASILGECATGETEDSLGEIYHSLKENLTNGSFKDTAWPAKKWQALDVFQPVSEHKNRHTCVTLPFESILKALKSEQK